ncbi:two-component sensor histidine kinase [Tissierella sp. P1]|uniref:sensor histidine kinase n=1 Tax=Tissierella sp. P1 TaxID=1280483 RepID=UPI000BA028BE|nr:HAMP domain-containing sensor histidine kinase [Tissierella sp. P1]OZV10345.1 two-component sensor histidine kinase [Tissierella sp. P1]
MKRLKLFPKIFFYTLVLMLAITLLASGIIYLLAPIMNDGGTLVEDIPGIAQVYIPRNPEISNVILRSLSYSITICIVVSLICAFFFSKAITKPIKHISETAIRMASLEKSAVSNIQSSDEIGMLSKSINELYQKLLSTIESLKEEKDRVSKAERQKVDFLRAASHELKTPVTALNAMLENMIMEVGKYKDYETYLPLCKEQTERLGNMISEILDTSKLSKSIESEESQTFNASVYLSKLCGQYQLIAKANRQHFKMDWPDNLTVCLPPKMFTKAFSNILSNAVAYTAPGKSITVYIKGRELIVENECQPIPEEHLKRIFEPFYRPDYARNREDGGNGFGLYIVASILEALNCSYSFCSMIKPLGMRFIIRL